MGSAFVHRRRVEFRDTDAAGIAHFSVFFIWMEQAEHAMLRELGLGVMSEQDGATIGWPRVSATCDFRQPVAFEDEVEVHVSVSRLGEKSVTYRFEFRRDNARIANGSVTTVCCQLDANQTWQAIPIPATFVEAFQRILV